MSIEKMNEQIERLKEQKREFDEQMDKKIADLEQKRDLALAAQTRRIFAKHHLRSDELLKLKYANKEQLKRVLSFIDEEITESADPEDKPETKNEKENDNHAKEVTS